MFGIRSKIYNSQYIKLRILSRKMLLFSLKISGFHKKIKCIIYIFLTSDKKHYFTVLVKTRELRHRTKTKPGPAN